MSKKESYIFTLVLKWYKDEFFPQNFDNEKHLPLYFEKNE